MAMEATSIFEHFHSLDPLAEPFTWEPYLDIEKPDPAEIIAKGELQEVKPDGSLSPTKYYEATYDQLIEFYVSFLLDSAIIPRKIDKR